MAPQTDKLLYGGALALALVGGAYALLGGAGPDATEPDGGPDARAESGAPSGEESEALAEAAPRRSGLSDAQAEEAAEVERALAAGRELAPGFVPDLPEVPDLEAEPPPPMPEVNDPRMAELATEMRALTRARGLIETEPREALSMLQEQRRLHPDGVLRQERDAFLIEALIALGRLQEAERRYYDFANHYPDSELRPRLAALLSEVPTETP